MKANVRSAIKRNSIYYPSIVSLITLLIAAELLVPGFISANSIGGILLSASLLAIVAIGQNIVIMSGGSGLDLSVGSVMIIAAIIGPNIRFNGIEILPVSFLIVMLIGSFIGLLNGLCIRFLGIPPLVMTLAMQGIVAGIAIFITESQVTVKITPTLNSISMPLWGPIRILTAIVIVMVVIVQLLLNYSTFGKQLLLVGNNREAARLSGLPVDFVAVFAYVLGSAFAAIAGLFLVGYAGSVHLDMTLDYPMLSVASVVIGGTRVLGGVGTFIGSSIGAIVLILLNSVLLALNMPAGARIFIQGIVLLLILLSNNRATKLRL